MRAIGLLIVGVLATASAAAEIYKTVDENGHTVYSDVPPRDDGSKQVTVTPLNSYPPAAPAAKAAPATSAGATVDAGYYSRIEIVEPTDDAAVRENAGNVVIAAALTPPLRGDHQLQLLLDGAAVDAEAQGGVFSLTNVDRGTHSASVQVVDAAGAVVTQSAPITFHMLRAIATPKPTPAPAKKPKS